MADSHDFWTRPRNGILLIGFIILLIFLYFFQPFEQYIIKNIPETRFHSVIFWFSALVGVIGFAIAHWQSFRRNIFQSSGGVNVEELVFDTLQISILTCVIICAGATLQAVEMLSEHLLLRNGGMVDQSFGERILTIVLLIVLAIGFYLLHWMVRAFRSGWHPRRPPHGARRVGGAA